MKGKMNIYDKTSLANLYCKKNKIKFVDPIIYEQLSNKANTLQICTNLLHVTKAPFILCILGLLSISLLFLDLPMWKSLIPPLLLILAFATLVLLYTPGISLGDRARKINSQLKEYNRPQIVFNHLLEEFCLITKSSSEINICSMTEQELKELATVILKDAAMKLEKGVGKDKEYARSRFTNIYNTFYSLGLAKEGWGSYFSKASA